jgi:phage gp46-like protein
MRIIPLGVEREPSLSPDLVWDGMLADLALAEAGEVSNRGGLRSREMLKTAVIIALLSDARAWPEELRDGDINRGWPGDTFDLAEGEAAIGSKLWLLARRTVDTVETPRLAETYAVEALQPLIAQGAAARADAVATADPARNRLTLDVRLTDRDGTVIVAEKFRVLWDEL